jgi:hypothetical protein
VKSTEPKTGYADYREMLDKEKLDIVAVCPRWIDQHHAMLMAAAEHGCHVYMEKPFCPTLEQADEVVQALDMRHLKLGIAHIAHYTPQLAHVKKLIADGEIGDVLEIRARGKEDRRGGGEDLWVLGSHMLDLMRAVAGNNVAWCFARVTLGGKPITKKDVVEGAEGLGPLAGDGVDAIYRRPVIGPEYLDISDQPYRARGRRLRPGEAGAQPVDAVLQPAPVVEHHRHLAARIAGVGRRRHPVDALRRIEREPVLIPELIQQPRLAFEQHAEALTLDRIGHGPIVTLPVCEMRDQIAIEFVADVV